MEDTYVRLINCRFYLPPSQYLLLFLKSSSSSIVLLPTPFTSVICPSMASKGGNFFSEYDRSNWLFFLGYYLEVSSSLLYAQERVH
jgi:hypothetical protein